jgi:hypothetical protein
MHQVGYLPGISTIKNMVAERTCGVMSYIFSQDRDFRSKKNFPEAVTTTTTRKTTATAT